MINELSEGAHVLSGEGDKLGDVERIVIDPSKREVTHVVVSKGLFFKEERVVPIELIAESDSDTIRLAPSIGLEELPVFEEAHYLTADSDAADRVEPPVGAAPMIWGYPVHPSVAGTGWPPYPAYPSGGLVTAERNVPDDSVVVRTGSSVVTSDGEAIGKVREAHVTEHGELMSFEVDPGWFKSKQTIPAHLVDTIREDRIALAVRSETIRQLQS